MSEISYYSEEGFKKLKEELEFLEQTERPRVTNEIAEARVLKPFRFSVFILVLFSFFFVKILNHS